MIAHYNWIYKNEIIDEVPLGFEAFIYIIERLNTDIDISSPLYYIGKKNFLTKESRGIEEENDWLDYYGSSKWLSKDVKRYGKECFKRTILHFCKTKGDANYLETFELMKHNVLERDDLNHKVYYNLNIAGVYLDAPTIFNIDSINEYINSQPQNKKVWINNTKRNRLINKNKLNKHIGKHRWQKGRLQQIYYITNRYSNKLITDKSIIPKGYEYGAKVKYTNNKKINKLIPVDDIDYFLKLNPKFRIETKNENNIYIWIHNYTKSFKINKEDLDKYLKEGYILGRLIHKNIPKNNYFAVKNNYFIPFYYKEHLTLFLKINKEWRKKDRTPIKKEFNFIGVLYNKNNIHILEENYNSNIHSVIKKHNPRKRKRKIELKTKEIKKDHWTISIADKFFNLF